MKRAVFLIGFFISTSIVAQNLVPNPGFEIYTDCPTDAGGLGQLHFAPPWKNPSYGSPDYFNVCSPPTSGNPRMGTPLNVFGYEIPHSGVAYAGFYTFNLYSAELREYIQVKLNKILEYDKRYYVHFYVSPADNYKYATNAIGAYFSKTAVSATNGRVLPFVPQVLNDSTNPLTNKDGWTRISGSFVAMGDEQYMIIGIFNSDANSDTVFIGSDFVNTDYSYYYIDDISVMDDTTWSDVGIIESNTPKIHIYPNPSADVLYIEGSTLFSSAVHVIISDIAGRELVNQRFASAKERISIPLHQYGLAEGVLFVKVLHDGDCVVEKVIYRGG